MTLVAALSIALPGLDRQVWTARLGPPGLDRQAWTARLGPLGLDRQAWTARLGLPGFRMLFTLHVNDIMTNVIINVVLLTHKVVCCEMSLNWEGSCDR